MLCVPAFALSPVGRLALDPMSADRHTCGPIPKRTFAPAWRDEGASCEAFNCSAACFVNRSSLFLGAAVTNPSRRANQLRYAAVQRPGHPRSKTTCTISVANHAAWGFMLT